MPLSDNPFSYGSGKFSVLGKGLPSLGETDWGSKLGPEAWRGFSSSGESESDSKSGSKFDAFKAAGIISSLFDKADERKYRGIGEKSETKVGSGLPGGAQQVLPNLGAVYAQQHAPVVIPNIQSGGGGGGGLFSDIGGLAGAAGQAAGIFGPLGAPIGMGVGKLIDRFANT